jgi:hypothetical protein
MIFLIIIIIALLAIALVAFVTWFFSEIADGKCPICMMKQILSSKLTIDISDEEDYDTAVSPAPIMGWSSWNTLRNHIDEDTILETAQAMCDTGLTDAGYKYINIDDCWQSSMRDSDGKLQGDLEAFPSGMQNLCASINSMGMKMGLYSSNGTLTCEDLPASLGNESIDAKTLASWGVEYFKYDFCHHEYISGSTPVIEYIDLNLRGKRADIRLSPEHAVLTGRAKIVNIKSLPTQKGIGFLNHNAGTASFTLDVSQAGEYVMTIHYNKTMSKRRAYLQVNVNGKIHEVFFPANHSFTPDARVQLYINLFSGENSITLSNPVVTRADSSYIQYKRMGNELRDASEAWAMYTNQEAKPITYSICEWGFAHPWNWGAKAGNMWRTTMDIKPTWRSITRIYNKNIKLYEHSSPAHVNDPDMLEVGNGKLTPEENKSHFALWCMMSAPLVIGCDVRNLLNGSKKSEVICSILTNKSLILIDQDPLVKSAKRINKQGSIDILARPLYNGDVALCFFNKSKKKKPIEFELNTLKDEDYLQFSNVKSVEIHDVWSDERYTSDVISDTVPAHGAKVYRISINN